MPFPGMDLTGDGGVTKQVITAAPDGAGCPPAGARVFVHYTGHLVQGGAQFDSSRGRGQPLEFKLGVGSVISAWDVAVAKMRQGETAVVHCTSEYGYGWEGSPPKIPKDAALRFEIELLGWKEKDKEDMSSAERLAHAQEVRTEGAELFKAAEWEAARFKFAEGAEYLDGAPRGEAEAQSALLSCLLNAAQCELKLGEWATAAERCGRALAVDAASVKALYRRGVAHGELGRHAEAVADLLAACKLEPKNREAREQYEKARRAHAEAKAADKAAFGGFLERAAGTRTEL